jgi:hypothetical protein
LRLHAFRTTLATAGVTALFALACAFPDSAAAQTARLHFAPLADAYVNNALPARNFGTRRRLRADAAPVVRGYIRFDVRGLNGRVAGAWLRFTTLAASSRGVRVHPVANTIWRERSITFNNAPPAKKAIDGSGPFRAGRRITLDVTRHVRGNGPFSFALSTGSGRSIPLASREAARLIEPRLVITTVVPQVPAGSDPVLVGAGDIAACGRLADERTAALLDWIGGVVFTVGDNVYPEGTPEEFRDCYDTSWGRHKARTRPTAGNHDYVFEGAPGYFGYFGGLAGDPAAGYYSYDLGAWHVVALNSNCAVVACEAGSPQEQWLRADLAAHPAACTVAYWHHLRFGALGPDPAIEAFWQALYEHGADVVLNGHRHIYERSAPQTPAGEADPVNGIRQFVAGTGGRGPGGDAIPSVNAEVLDGRTFGVLKLTLHPTSYDWEFVPIAGATFTDSGSATCH